MEKKIGKNKVAVSDFDRYVNQKILATMGVMRISGNTLASQIKRSSNYVYKRLNEESEWNIGDIASICKAWNMSIDELLEF